MGAAVSVTRTAGSLCKRQRSPANRGLGLLQARHQKKKKKKKPAIPTEPAQCRQTARTYIRAPRPPIMVKADSGTNHRPRNDRDTSSELVELEGRIGREQDVAASIFGAGRGATSARRFWIVST